jgi:hypothetical protein
MKCKKQGIGGTSLCKHFIRKYKCNECN